MKPPFPYFGAKQTIADRIVSLLPPHGHYVEPYCGSLAVLLAKPRVKIETVNDLDASLITFWRVLRDRPEELARVCALTPHSRGEYVLHKNNVDAPDDLETARRVWVILSQGRGGSLRESKNGWKHYVYPGGTSVGMPGYLDAYVGRIAAAAERLHNVSLESMPALDLIVKYGAQPDVLLYVDPPYLGETRDSRLNYRHEMKSEFDHRELAEALKAAGGGCCRFGLSVGALRPRVVRRLVSGGDLDADWQRRRREPDPGRGAVVEPAARPSAFAVRRPIHGRNRSMSTDQDQERGIYGKYRVQRLHDEANKHYDCPFFVLDPVHDPYARVAMLAYADACEAEYPQLAMDLRDRATASPVATAFTKPQALIKLVSTRWGNGSTTCFACGGQFTYATGARIFNVTAPDLCDRPCQKGSHRWDCAALGGDLCVGCFDAVSEDGPGVLGLKRGATDHLRDAEILTAYANADWSRPA